METAPATRIIIIDDTQAIHDDFSKVLSPRQSAQEDELLELESQIFHEEGDDAAGEDFELDHAFQGKEGLDMVKQALEEGRPYSLAFVDVRMPPGIDGVETTERLLELDPTLQIVLCTAFSDHTWRSISERIGPQDGFLVLKKPFDSIEVLQFAHTLTRKWTVQRETARLLEDLEDLVADRTSQLQKEMEERLRVEADLRMSQKLDSIGQLAAGIAHEINTPIQFVGDNTRFLQDVFGDILELVMHYRVACKLLEDHHAEAVAKVVEAEEEVDIEFVQKEVPESLQSSLEGIEKVAGIVRALREFSHPGGGEKDAADLNRAIENTVAVSRSEYKYVADVELQLEEIPSVSCHLGEINQVILNLLVNAAHAIGDNGGAGDERGKITIASRVDGDDVVISVKDTGGGIPEEIADKVFDPFFTTKDVGRGTGQGLSIARACIVEKHGGDLSFDVEEGVGTTFHIRVPISGSPASAES